MAGFRRLEVRDCAGTLWALYARYEGRAIASFEGDLCSLRLDELTGSSFHETPALRRQTIDPRLDFVTVPVNRDTIPELKRRFSASGVLGSDGAVIHTQLAVGNDLLLIAGDNFHDECTVVSIAVPEELLETMRSRGILRGYRNL